MTILTLLLDNKKPLTSGRMQETPQALFLVCYQMLYNVVRGQRLHKLVIVYGLIGSVVIAGRSLVQ